MRDALCTLGRLDLLWVRNGSLMIARLPALFRHLLFHLLLKVLNQLYKWIEHDKPWDYPDSSIPALISKGSSSSIPMCCTTHHLAAWAARRIFGRVVSTSPYGLLLKRYFLGSLLAPWCPSEVERSWTAGQWPQIPRFMSTPFGWCILDTRVQREQWHGQIATIWWRHLSGAKIWISELSPNRLFS